MKRKLCEILGVLIVAMLLLSMIAFPVMAGVPTEPKPDADAMWIEPGYQKFNTSDTDIGKLFNITVWLKITSSNFYIYQVKLKYNTAWLNALKAGFTEPPTSQFCSGHTTVATGPDLSVASEVFFGETLLGADLIAPPRVGSLVWIEFNITDAPLKGECLSGVFDITTTYPTDTWVWNPDGDLIPTVQYDGLVEYNWAAPPNPNLEVDPALVTYTHFENAVGETFDIKIYIDDLSAAWYLTNASFILCYNSTLINFTNVVIDPFWFSDDNDGMWWYDEGPCPPHPGTWDRIHFFVTDMCTPPYPAGRVLVATVTFHVKYQDTIPPRPPCSHDETPLFFCEVILFDHSIEIPTKEPVEGRVVIEALQIPPHTGLKVSGTPADMDEFLKLLEEASGKDLEYQWCGGGGVYIKNENPGWPIPSKSLRDLIDDIIKTCTYTINIELGSKSEGCNVFVDDFYDKTIDLKDLCKFPKTPPATAPWASDKFQVLAHILGQYRHNAATGQAFDPSHAAGIDAENNYRRDRGQKTTKKGAVGKDLDGDKQFDIGYSIYSDGKIEKLHIDKNGDLTGIDYKDPNETEVGSPQVATIIGEVLELGPVPPAWAGICEMRQLVKYNVNEQAVIVWHIVAGGKTADPADLGLDRELFRIGNILQVYVRNETDPLTGEVRYVDFDENYGTALLWEPHVAPPNAMWVEPPSTVFSTNMVPVGYRFNITVWVNLTVPSYTWQVKLLFDKLQLKATGVGYTADGTSQFFKGLTTVPVIPVIGDYNATHGFVQHGESLLGPIQRDAGFGSLMWIEFEIIGAPLKGGILTSEFDITETYPSYTYVLTPAGLTITTTQYDGLYTYISWPHVDVAIIDITCSKTVVGEGYCLSIDVTVENQGDFVETFNVTLYANFTILSRLYLTTPSGTILLRVIWNTIGFQKGTYIISAATSMVPYEIDVGDNGYFDGSVIVAMVGDITGPDGWPDGKCDMSDIFLAAKAFGSYLGHPKKWNPNADINNDNKVDMRDIYLIVRNFGKKDP